MRRCLKKFIKHATSYPKATIIVWLALVCIAVVVAYIDEEDALPTISAIIGQSIIFVPMKVFWLEFFSDILKLKRTVSSHGLRAAFGVSDQDKGFFVFVFLSGFIAALFALPFLLPLLIASL